mgnify:CR=1 FL=1
MEFIKPKVKRLIKASLFLYVISIVLSSGLVAEASSRTYEVSFRAGSQGTIDGGSSYEEKVEYNQSLPYDITYYDGLVVSNPGYYFTGWSPEIDTTVTEKAVYVAQYAKVIEGVDYHISFVDDQGTVLETHKVGVTEEGAVITANALDIEGYTADAETKTVTAKGEDTEIKFIYTPTKDKYQSGNGNKSTTEDIKLPDKKDTDVLQEKRRVEERKQFYKLWMRWIK